ncbi:MAG TPA: hypothetical protein VH186_07040 [Chloroflexia bacterium]|nr:hypothetical protein [Chloroflexia bacterium]
MSKDLSNPTPAMLEAVGILKACLPLSERLVKHGITVALSDQELSRLSHFEPLMLAEYSESEWSYLRVASGVKLNGVAALISCLARNRKDSAVPFSLKDWN